ncbi:MAG: hypothetical protein A2937_02040 [Candidatus Yonathbacteria bacterium RIFCSPLOWO2_01_FULL_47_33b]|uniref:Lnb N-terminal periplasmic domain-containing protein n=1 Tax=Candidatus Yonathbacteria bacterium RIFCSPLOWO2_01_FULL_47_33b TaxID=1802727 RepID=A0A1G2SG20_9BACT|nr:MAG: hypothetical protein A2937_02040 [Candidatus Yonathbacteria bacterium RIFCSPLOWO2_01_FULL_47_33b]
MKYLKLLGKIILALIAFVAVAYTLLVLVVRPSNDRDWTVDQAVLPYAEIDGDQVSIHNIRNFAYTSTSDYTPNYYDATFDLRKIKNVYFVVEPFSGYVGAAHTFLSFEFEDNRFVSVSVEIRKEKGESFSATKGVLRQYELTYVIADERDVVKLRSNYRHDKVYVYPIKTTPEKMRAVFLSMIERANELKEKPEFYNTLTSNCTTNIAKHVNAISPGRVSWNITYLLPENADRYVYDIGLIDNTLSFEQTREKYFINDRATQYADSPDFSLKIRGR